MIWGTNSPTFRDFVDAAQRAQPQDCLVYKGWGIGKKLPYEKQGDALNRKTWKAFSKAVGGAFSQKKREHICQRYGFDWDTMIKSDHPLERRYVEYFGVGAETAYTYNLLEVLRKRSWLPGWTLSGRSVDELYHLHQGAVGHRFLGKTKDPSRVSGAPSLSHENFAPDYFEMDRQRCNLFRGVADLVSRDPCIPRQHPYYSRLCMGIVSLLETEPKIRDREIVIPAPGARDGELDYYKVHDIVSYGGMTAVALVPISNQSTLKPILAFRCTKQTLGQAEAIPSMLNDIELNIGESGYKSGCEALKKLVEDPKFTQGGKFKVLCYSLGGAHAAYFMRDHWKKVSEFVGFNFVGSDDCVVESIARQINELPKDEIPPSFYLYRNICDRKGKLGDWVNKSGKKHVGFGIKHPNSRIQLIEWIIDTVAVPSENVYDPVQVKRWLDIHGVRPMDSEREDELKSPFGPSWKYSYNIFRGHTMCSEKLDTYKRDGGLEDARLKLGHKIVHKVMSTTYSFLDFVFRVFGIEFFR